MTLNQCEKELKKAGVEYSRLDGNMVLFCRDRQTYYMMLELMGELRFVIENAVNGNEIISFKFNQITVTGGNLKFSWRGESPLVVKIK